MTDGHSSPQRSAAMFLLAQASRLPGGLGKPVFEAVALASTMAEPRRLASAYRWASANETDMLARCRTTLALLAHRGRTLVELWTPVFEEPAELRARVDLEGREHLEAVAGRPSLMLGFHLGTSLNKWALAVNGYHCVVASAGDGHFYGRAPARAGWAMVPMNEGISLAAAEHGDRGRAVALLHLRDLLQSGARLLLAGDGQIGRELFRVPLPVGSFVVRSGWWLLRRQTGAPVVPVLGYREGGRAIVTAYPPLPDPVSDPAEDAERCREQLAPLLRQFVADHPEQCLPWTFGS